VNLHAERVVRLVAAVVLDGAVERGDDSLVVDVEAVDREVRRVVDARAQLKAAIRICTPQKMVSGASLAEAGEPQP
jgi:hypothetical protein